MSSASIAKYSATIRSFSAFVQGPFDMPPGYEQKVCLSSTTSRDRSHQRAQPRRLRVSLFALIAVEPASTAAQPIFGKQLKRRTFLNASRFG